MRLFLSLFVLAVTINCMAQAADISWRTFDWTPCTSNCNGAQSRRVACMNYVGATLDDSLCIETKPPTMRTCNPCQFQWRISAWGNCGCSCNGEARFANRTVTCINAATGVEMGETSCTGSAAGAKPIDSQSCPFQSCGATWKSSEWTSCTPAICGGTQTRTVTCLDANGTPRADADCAARCVKPDTSKACSNVCKKVWKVKSVWDKCTATCGGGTSKRDVQCIDPTTGDDVNPALCIDDPKPASSQPCNTQGCVGPAWLLGSYSSCSVQCGTGGTQTRSVQCVDLTSTNQANVQLDSVCINSAVVRCVNSNRQLVTDPAVCTTLASGNKPATSKPCSSCPIDWKVGAWQPCTTNCSSRTGVIGSQAREVLCQDASGTPQNPSLCPTPKPINTQPCNTARCVRDWSVSACPTCEQIPNPAPSQLTRTVTCIDSANNNAAVADSACTDNGIPKPTNSCDEPFCGRWSTSVWEPCNILCTAKGGVFAAGTQSRNSTCVNRVGATQSPDVCNAAGLVKPATSQACNTNQCLYQWIQKSSPCTCSTPTHSITYVCGDVQGNEVASSFCADIVPQKPADQTSVPCNVAPCWSVDTWSPCTCGCGSGTQNRTVACLSAAGTVTTGCNNALKPAAIQPCNIATCAHQWNPKYSGCSGTCTEATQTLVSNQCLERATGAVVSNEHCQRLDVCLPIPPPQPCYDCYRWSVSDWNAPCNKDCICQGTTNSPRTRSVSCVYAGNNTVVGDHLCETYTHIPRPVASEACPNFFCNELWLIGSWSKCPVCGNNNDAAYTQHRSVICSDRANQILPAERCNHINTCRPIDSQPCTCTADWLVGAWSTCNACQETQTRSVNCIDTTGSVATNPSVCNPATKPADSRVCTDTLLCGDPIVGMTELADN